MATRTCSSTDSAPSVKTLTIEVLAQSLPAQRIGTKTRQIKECKRNALHATANFSGVLPMSLITRASSQVLVLAALLLAGCAADGSTNFFTTGALGTSETAAAPEPKVDPACVSLVSRIEALRKEGVADKIEKAAAKKYKMTNADLAKADQLTKANADFQLRCSTIMPKPMSAQLSSSSPARWRPWRPLRRRKQRPREGGRRIASTRRLTQRTSRPDGLVLRCERGLAEPVARCGRSRRIFFRAPVGSGRTREVGLRGRDLCCCKVATRRVRTVEIVATLCFVGAGDADDRGGIGGPHGVTETSGRGELSWRRLPGAPRAAATAIRARARWRRGRVAGRSGPELDQLDRRGTQAKVEAASQGKKLAAKDKADVDRYNSLLNQYLGARCHA